MLTEIQTVSELVLKLVQLIVHYQQTHLQDVQQEIVMMELLVLKIVVTKKVDCVFIEWEMIFVTTTIFAPLIFVYLMLVVDLFQKLVVMETLVLLADVTQPLEIVSLFHKHVHVQSAKIQFAIL